jgi:hypothetical protein
MNRCSKTEEITTALSNEQIQHEITTALSNEQVRHEITTACLNEQVWHKITTVLTNHFVNKYGTRVWLHSHLTPQLCRVTMEIKCGALHSNKIKDCKVNGPEFYV